MPRPSSSSVCVRASTPVRYMVRCNCRRVIRRLRLVLRVWDPDGRACGVSVRVNGTPLTHRSFLRGSGVGSRWLPPTTHIIRRFLGKKLTYSSHANSRRSNSVPPQRLTLLHPMAPCLALPNRGSQLIGPSGQPICRRLLSWRSAVELTTRTYSLKAPRPCNR